MGRLAALVGAPRLSGGAGELTAVAMVIGQRPSPVRQLGAASAGRAQSAPERTAAQACLSLICARATPLTQLLAARLVTAVSGEWRPHQEAVVQPDRVGLEPGPQSGSGACAMPVKVTQSASGGARTSQPSGRGAAQGLAEGLDGLGDDAVVGPFAALLAGHKAGVD